MVFDQTQHNRELAKIETLKRWGCVLAFLFLFVATGLLAPVSLDFILINSFLMMFVPIYLLSSFLVLSRRRSGRLKARTATEVVQDDLRPPILYLRPFDFDGKPINTGRRSFQKQAPSATFETIYTREANRIGPVLTLGDPKEPLPELGAARLYVRERGHKWKNAVSTLAERSQQVILLFRESVNVMWELEFAINNVERTRLVIVVPEESLRQNESGHSEYDGMRLAI